MPKRTKAYHSIDQKRFLLDSLNQAQCNFDVNSFCSWRNVHGFDDFDWVLYRSSTPTDETGPDFDHTTRNSSGSYIFTESSAPRNLFDTAWIQSPTIELTSEPVHCFRFWYHMYGSSIGRLNVYQVTNGGLPGKLVWSLSGDQGNSWKEGQVPLNSHQSYSILLSGIIGNGYQGDIAVDDINVSVGYCNVKPSNASRTDVTNTTSITDITTTTISHKTTPTPPSWSEWQSVIACSTTCGSGFEERKRNCSSGKNNDCPGSYFEVVVCNNRSCDVDGIWTQWSETCSVTCGGGLSIRTRACFYPDPDRMGKPCSGGNAETNVCNTNVCPVDGIWATWTAWGDCSKSCDKGSQTRARACAFLPNATHGLNCSGDSKETRPCQIAVCPADGSWADWSDWSQCTKTCGSEGSVFRARSCVFDSDRPHGTYCPGNRLQRETCTLNNCIADGAWNEWSTWSQCSHTCAGGKRSRSRVCLYRPDFDHGLPCPGGTLELQECGLTECPADGSWADWSDWSQCTKTCGSEGSVFRARSCVFDSDRPHGTYCPGDRLQRETCTLNNCIADGAWNEWSTWSQCSHTCAGGKRSRSRVCLYRPDFDHGLPCPGGTLELQECGLTECPVDGVWSIWYKWSQCTVTCGTGRAVRNRTCSFYTRYPDTPHGDDCDGEHAQAKDCNTQLCPVDARWSTWSAFSTCSQTCGGGRRTKARQCIYDEVAPIGLNCTGQSTVTEECSTNECPIDGIIQPWNSWTFCSTSCGGGVHTRTRDCYFPPNRPHGADCKEQLNETAPCSVQYCPTTTTTPPPTTTLPTADGHWSNWTSWTVCTLTCGGGQQYRERQCTYPDHTLHGQYCPGPKNQTQECNSRNCPVDGIWTQWSAYSKCSVSCASGFQTRTRQCQFDPRYDRGNSCPGNETSTQLCDNGHCPVDGVFENWSTWNACPVTCGGGIQDRVRVCHFPLNVPHGLACLGISHENQTCGNSDCPVDGVLTEWSQWADCTLTCGGGHMIRNRTCYFPTDIPHGHDCVGNLNFAKACATHACPVDGVWNDWASWATCSLTCGGGSQQRTRRCHYDSNHHGTPCAGPDTETRDCSTDHCPIDGNWNTWNLWTSCSVTCSNGTKSRARECYFVPNEPKGNNCSGSANETFDCNLGLCPVWSSWFSGTCSVTCGQGNQARLRHCSTGNSADCNGPAFENATCHASPCAVDGHWSEWSTWSNCDVTCASGHTHRTRNCSNPKPLYGGSDCQGDTVDTKSCTLQNCPTWSQWFTGECSVTCGDGSASLLRMCSTGKDSDCSGTPFDSVACHKPAC
ncbi:SCO-spondin-like [Dreissena polymorpha]|nr:SCO-spondin-like [Dreissena polymorpha]